MTAKLLTSRTVELAKPRRVTTGGLVRAEYPDAACPGLYLIVQPSGARSWALRYRRPGGKTAKLTLGRADKNGLALAAARHAASAARLRLDGGEDPKPKRLPIAAYSAGDAIETAVASFLDLHASRKNRPATVEAAELAFNRCILPAWRGRTVDSVRRRDVIALIEEIAVNRPYLANRTLAVLSKFFRWLQARDVIEIVPTIGVARPFKERPRKRALTDDEICRLWRAAEAEGGAFGAALRLLLLSGARLGEVSHLQWSELDRQRQLWILPAERAKNAIEHTMPLPTQAWAILDQQPRFDGCPYVYTANGRTAINSWSWVKKRLSAAAGIDEESWRLHDLRRSCATGMQRLGIEVAVIERCLNHRSGTFRGIVGTYQTYDYLDEMRLALQRWGDHIEQLVTGKPANVVKLRPA